MGTRDTLKHEIHVDYDEDELSDSVASCLCGWMTSDRNTLIVAERSREHLIEMNPAGE